MQMIRVEDAVGSVLCHDITRIVPGKAKGPAFKKGHIVSAEDIPELLKMGKEHLYVWELNKGFVHENDAGLRIAQVLKGQGLSLTEPSEGKVKLVAETDGLCVIDEKRLLELNMLEEIAAATVNNGRPVKKGMVVAGVRVIPLVIAEEKLVQAEAIAPAGGIVEVKPFRPYKVGVITTGSEVFHGRIEDKFGPVVREKVEAFGCRVIAHIIVPDDVERISGAIKTLLAGGAEMILTTGGMSVDPDDVTPTAIRAAGASIVTYGAPVLPGAMLMVAYMDQVPILGLPGCVMYHKTTVFDLVLTQVLAGQTITREMIAKLGMGGMCLECEVCHYPKCSFGTGA
ncbi:molybdopterin-binding protein [Anaeroselena agilis]|uniref:Molybdopterin molybdenumtransferase n=1 Tax=Anaeroselena agilis TaxID=3063788 RepID=A0ABU3NSM0_9FIRM|nr:molybdopterin-binding protein [Selenomonadales bacterium 4137-cl]